jgi:hypothetical protein
VVAVTDRADDVAREERDADRGALRDMALSARRCARPDAAEVLLVRCLLAAKEAA